MYQPPNGPGDWSAQQHPNQPPQSQQPPQQWSPQPPSGQQQGPFPRPGNPNQMPPIAQNGPPTGPQAIQPQQHPDHYRTQLPSVPQMYAQGYQPPTQMQYPPTQPAPRQRTAIACRYCRRRKIRCSGFDQSEDGRCTNCQRFSQECVFTPVSAQTQAFVPAHTIWRGQNPPPNTQLYGAYGQPLPQHGNRDSYPQAQPQQQQQAGQYPPPPPGYQQQQPMYGQQPGQQMPAQGTKRSSDEPHTPTLPPPNPGAPAQISQQQGYAVQSAKDPNSFEPQKDRGMKDVGVQVDLGPRIIAKEQAS